MLSLNLALQLPGGMEWIFIIVVIAVLIFGAKKIPELARTFGKAKGEYEKGKIEADKELKEFKEKQDETPK
ncbi:MAG TPA: twin-arginine translocase TatA/TatE family subunit [Nitrosopumilaceae archaeon]|jgi:sec-independent protein translocase protein TatA|nr:twin-arginine translocase TatA/TatE family subunit [Nitrosopumilaceae archaeon]